MANQARQSKRTGFGPNRAAINPMITNVDAGQKPKSPKINQITIDGGTIEQYDGTSWNQLGGSVLLASEDNPSNETLSGTALTLIEKTINATTNKTYLLQFCCKIASAGSTSFSVYVDDVLSRTWTFAEDTVNFSKLLSLSAGARVIKIKASGAGTISAGNAELGVYL